MALLQSYTGFPSDSESKGSTCNAEDPGLLPGLERSPGDRPGNPLQYSCLENSMDRGARRATVHAITELDLTEALNTDTHIAIDRMVEISSCPLHMFPAEAKQGCMQLFWISTNVVKSAPYLGLFNAISFFFFHFCWWLYSQLQSMGVTKSQTRLSD